VSYSDLVYRLGRRYSQARQQNPGVEYPEISGNLSDLLDRTALNDLPPLQGEYTIAYYDNHGTNHLLRVYFEAGTYEACGTPPRSGFPNLSLSYGTD
jgi:hypothetical protein